jgi:cell division protein FtsB
MITESMTIEGIYIISLSLTANEKWKCAGSFRTTSPAEGFFTILAVIALITAVSLLFWVFARYKRSEHNLNLKVTELTVKNAKLQQENNKLTATNEKLHQENAELYRKQVEALENIINTEIPLK